METNADLQRLEELKNKKLAEWKELAWSGDDATDRDFLERAITEAFDLGQMLEAQKHNQR